MEKKSKTWHSPIKPMTVSRDENILEDEDQNSTESDLDEIIALLRQAIWKYHELVEKGEIKLGEYDQSLEIIGKDGARLGRLIEIRKKWNGAEDGGEKFRQAVSGLVKDLDKSLLKKEDDVNGI